MMSLISFFYGLICLHGYIGQLAIIPLLWHCTYSRLLIPWDYHIAGNFDRVNSDGLASFKSLMGKICSLLDNLYLLYN